MATMAEVLMSNGGLVKAGGDVIAAVVKCEEERLSRVERIKTEKKLGQARSNMKVLLSRRDSVVNEILVVSQTVVPGEGRRYARAKSGQKPRLEILRRESSDLTREIGRLRVEIEKLTRDIAR